MDAGSYVTLGRCLGCLTLATDQGRSLDAVLEHLLATLAETPGCGRLAVVLDDEGGRPCIRASRGEPDVGLLLSGALDRPNGDCRPRVLRRGRAPVVAEADGSVAIERRDAAMLAAPVVVGREVVGFFFAESLLGPEADLAADVRLTGLVAALIGRAAGLAAQGMATVREMSRELAFLRSKVSLRYRHLFSIGHSKVVAALRSTIDRAALSDDPVVLVGEPGSGRGVLARVIHELSPRAVRPFLVAPDPRGEDAAARLFGGDGGAGAFPGPGLLEEADGGALLFGDAQLLPPEIVARLARFLKTGTFCRQGGNRQRRADTRLFFKFPPEGPGPELVGACRLFSVTVPSLRQRREDIPALLEYFLALGEQRAGRRLGLTSKALKALEGYDWPGNIQELETVVARLAVVTTGDRIDITDIPPDILAESERPPVLPEDAAELRDMERQQVVSALERHGWVQSRAARELGLTLRQIGYRIRKYGLTREGNGAGDGSDQTPESEA